MRFRIGPQPLRLRESAATRLRGTCSWFADELREAMDDEAIASRVRAKETGVTALLDLLPPLKWSKPSVLGTVGCSSRSTPGALLPPFNRRCDDPYDPSRED